MSLSWHYLTKSPLPLKYRDLFATILIANWIGGKYNSYCSEKRDYENVTCRVYTHDESDINFREKTNMADHVVRREKAMAFAAMIKQERAKKERVMMLDAYNYLNNKNHQTD